MKNKKLILAVIALAVVAAVLAGVYFATRPDTEVGTKTITVEVVHSSGVSVTREYTTQEEYLGPVLLSEGLVEGETGPYGLVINTVEGETADWDRDQSYWALYIGDEYAMTGADAVSITDGGVYRLVYTIG